MKKAICFLIIIILFLCGCAGQTTESSAVLPSENEAGKAPQFTFRMIDVGQGLCLLIESDGHYMIYDGGGRDHSSYVVSFLTKELGIDHIDLMIASHYDEDHIAGLNGVLNTMAVDQVICPDYGSETQIFQSFINSVQEKDIPVIHPATGDTFTVGDAEIEIMNDGTLDVESENDRSIACKVSYGTTSILITGDCEEAAEINMQASDLPLSSDIYVAGHHGSATSSTDNFLKTVSPDVILVSCGIDNTYGHPAQAMLDRISSINAKLYRTDLQGTIIMHADQNSYWFDQKQCDNWSPGQYIEEIKELPANADDYKYILNTNSKLIHRPDCDSVKKMSDKNKEYTNRDIESLKKSGYRPCHNCNPK